MNTDYQVIIIGAGAAGMMCAITASQRGRKVLVLDHANKIGKKILMSGGGRCNFTNYTIDAENYLSNNPHFSKSALSRYTQWDFIGLVDDYGIDYYDKGQGQLFCRKSSKEIRDLLVSECQKYKVRIELKTSVLDIKAFPPSQESEDSKTQDNQDSDGSRFVISTKNCDYQCDSVVIATGGLSIPTMGATDFGYNIAKQFGHTVLPTRPALTPVIFDQKWRDKTQTLPGNSLKVTVSTGEQSFTDQILFTHKGLSGPAILQISNYWEPGMPLVINLLPDLDAAIWLEQQRVERGEILLKTLLSTQFTQAFSEFLCNELDLNIKLKQLQHADLNRIQMILNEWTLYPDCYEGYRIAEVTHGGIDTNDVSSKTMESNKQSGLYFIGEVLDVTGHLGGYNFQWAWSSGYASGSFV
ncbi:MAG: NAD(P)/FAD-dependent oxidoreductase [Kangiellaceae bacterium]|nr:NAD(P)/FAD-dependent oxidoreductase [Kangiellaceae bacterium]